MKKIAVLGCFRSGTNYSKSILESNFDCLVRNNLFGWKHGFLPIVSQDSEVTYNVKCDAAFFVTKNPFSFLVSLHRYFKSAGLNIIAKPDFSDFVKNRIIIFDGGNPDSVQLRFSSPIELWNSMNWNYFSDKKLAHVRYEMLLQSPEKTAKKLASKLNVAAKKGVFKIPNNVVKRMNDKQTYSHLKQMETATKFRSNQYLNNEYMSQFSPELIDFVKGNVDMELLEQLGYAEMFKSLCLVDV